ncbi:MAG: sn-glycerol-3-phosphate ABC transporter ATP-binding protein UgpC [Pseudomonadota bacterium]
MAGGYVEYHGLKKNFGSVPVLHGIDLQIEEGAFVVLVGPSGCGKSTLLRMTAGLESVTDGDIHIAGRLVNRVRPSERGIAMVFQSYALYPHMSVNENLAFSLKMRKTPLAAIVEAIASVAGTLKLSPLLERLPAQLSGGQRQRVAMGRALVREPAVFLFDEPLSNLDAKLRVEMRAEIKALHQRLDTTTIYVTHDQIEAMTMADVVVVMHDGRIEQVGPPLEIYDRPENLFVADFLGSPAMNLFDGIVVASDAGATPLAVEVTGGARLALPAGIDVAPGRQVVYGIRPEHVALTTAADGEPVTLTLVEPAGWETHLHADLHGQELRILTVERVAGGPGDAAGIRIDPARVHLFDRATGRRL